MCLHALLDKRQPVGEQFRPALTVSVLLQFDINHSLSHTHRLTLRTQTHSLTPPTHRKLAHCPWSTSLMPAQRSVASPGPSQFCNNSSATSNPPVLISTTCPPDFSASVWHPVLQPYGQGCSGVAVPPSNDEHCDSPQLWLAQLCTCTASRPSARLNL